MPEWLVESWNAGQEVWWLFVIPLVVCVASLFFEPINHARHRSRCVITEEWSGLFIGRRECLVHHIHWDNGQRRCPKADTEGRSHVR